MSGGRVRASLRHGARGPTGVVSGPPSGQGRQLLAAQGFTQEVIGVEARNVGRLAIQITGVEVVLANGVRVSQLQGTLGPDLPYRLDAQSAATWFLPAAPVRAAVKASASIGKGTDPCNCWMEVGLGSGKAVRTKERILLGS